MTRKLIKKSWNSVKKQLEKLPITYSATQAIVNGLTILLKLSLNHFMVRKERPHWTLCIKLHLANKRVWVHGRDYYRISNDYQHYEHQFDELGAGSGIQKLTKIALAINMNNLDQWERREDIRNPVAKIRSGRLGKQGVDNFHSDKKADWKIEFH